MKKNNKREFTIMEKSIGIGVMTGTIVGVLTDNIGLWLPFGVSFGIVFGVVIGTTQKNTKI
jgi:F0F1-type ATP synthase assembly protein I